MGQVTSKTIRWETLQNALTALVQDRDHGPRLGLTEGWRESVSTFKILWKRDLWEQEPVSFERRRSRDRHIHFHWRSESRFSGWKLAPSGILTAEESSRRDPQHYVAPTLAMAIIEALFGERIKSAPQMVSSHDRNLIDSAAKFLRCLFTNPSWRCAREEQEYESVLQEHLHP